MSSPYTLLGFVHQRRRNYAVLKALGFTRAQIRTTILTQSGAALISASLASRTPAGRILHGE